MRVVAFYTILGFTGLLSSVNAEYLAPADGFNLVGQYNLQGIGKLNHERLGGGFIDPTDPDWLYLPVDVETTAGRVWRIKLTRDANGKITAIDLPNKQFVGKFPYIDHFSVNQGPNGEWFYSFTDSTFFDDAEIPCVGEKENSNIDCSFSPGKMCHGNYSSAAKQVVEAACFSQEDFKALNVLYPDDEGNNLTLRGPYLTGWYPNEAKDYMLATSLYGLFKFELDPVTPYNPTSATYLCGLSRYTAGSSSPPSGTYSKFGYALVTDWSEKKVEFIHLDKATGYCINDTSGLPELGINNTKKTLFVDIDEDGGGPWGYFTDPLTNDVFVTHWTDQEDEDDGLIHHYDGFPPGISIVSQVNILAEIGECIFAATTGKPCPNGHKPGSVTLGQPDIVQSCAEMVEKLETGFNSSSAANFSAALTDPVVAVLQSDAYAIDVLNGDNATEYTTNLGYIKCGIEQFSMDFANPEVLDLFVQAIETIDRLLNVTEDPVVRQNFLANM